MGGPLLCSENDVGVLMQFSPSAMLFGIYGVNLSWTTMTQKL